MRTRLPALAGFASTALLMLLLWASGCQSDNSSPGQQGPDDRPNTCGADLTSDVRNCGECGHECGANHYCKASKCEAGCPERIFYVSNAGNDLNYGCSQAAPRQSIATTIELARSLGVTTHEIRVCAGTYVEGGLSLEHPVSLRGGYDCASWARADGRETVLQHDGGSGATLSIRGTRVGPSVTVEGLTIRGGSGAQGGGALLVSTGAAPVLVRNVITGGSAVAAGDLMASYGIYLQAGAAPEIADSTIGGGSGTAQGSFGSVGIAVASDAGQPRIHGNRIDGGTGTTTLGVATTGLLFSGKGALTGELAVKGNEIRAGAGRVLGASGTGSIGVLVNDAAAIELAGNVIEGGTSTCAGSCPVRGVSVSTTRGVRLAGNRIYGGDATPASAMSWGVLVADSGDAVLENNMVHAGGRAGTMNTVYGVEVSQSSGVAIRGNTLFGAPVPASGESQALGVTRQSSNVSIENNLLIGSGSAQGVGLLLFACPAGSSVASFRHNVFANFGDNLAYGVVSTGNVECNRRDTLTSISNLEQFVTTTAGNSSSRVGGDALVTAAPRAIFASWTDAQSGYPELIATGWKLAANTPCAIARGGDDLSGTLSGDAFGATRSVPFSVGAEELADDSACKP
ncbi:right-handed parallel beta-helix repeat-containing protein [Pendulispora rubella]|uniref:Right-handed parallel beta-helix repeat-containing protein n=1 Tax=Pendulispora rubella TaxID=2741070 RepID=A0ABZ2LDY6_9BACT